MPLKLALLAAVAVLSGGGATFLLIRLGGPGPAFPLVYLGVLVCLTCVLRIITLRR